MDKPEERGNSRKKNRRKMILRLVFVAVLILIIIYTLKGELTGIGEQLRNTSLISMALILAATVIYHLIEAWITYTLARRCHSGFPYRKAVYCAFYSSFYRLSTLGSASGVAAIYYLGKNEVGYSEATGLYVLQYVIHKISIAIFSGLFFFINWKMMASNYYAYAPYLLLAYGLTAVIALVMILFCVSKKFHVILLALLRKLNRSGKLHGVIEKLEESSKSMEGTASELIRDGRTVFFIVLRNLAKLCFWYSIPFLITYGGGAFSLIDSWSITSLAVTAAAVIPTPASIGSTELIMTGLFSLVTQVDKAAAATIMYRVGTFILPFVIGACLILISKLIVRLKKESAAV